MTLVAQVAQSVEQWTENPRVGGSIPSLGTISTSCMRAYRYARIQAYMYEFMNQSQEIHEVQCEE
jgi:hypothetical protein